MKTDSHKFCEIAIDSWNDRGKLLSCMKAGAPIWAFRGQGDKEWPLSTRFERDAEQYQCTKYHYQNTELYMLSEFQRRAHLFEHKLPELNNSIEWLSFLQHYGGSTRLLDFTDSFFIAAFFAMENSTDDSAVWAININMLIDSVEIGGMSPYSHPYREIVKAHKDRANECLNSKEESENSVLLIDPFLQHTRLWMQQGIFLFPCNRQSSFEKNLCAAFEITFDELSSADATQIETARLEEFDFRDVAILKIVISRDIHKEALYDLHEMNVNPSTLFPGLDGFARSLNLHLRRFELFHK